MRKVNLIVHEKYAGKQNVIDVFAVVFLSDTAALTTGESPSIMKSIDGVKMDYFESIMNQRYMHASSADIEMVLKAFSTGEYCSWR